MEHVYWWAGRLPLVYGLNTYACGVLCSVQCNTAPDNLHPKHQLALYLHVFQKILVSDKGMNHWITKRVYVHGLFYTVLFNQFTVCLGCQIALAGGVYGITFWCNKTSHEQKILTSTLDYHQPWLVLVELFCVSKKDNLTQCLSILNIALYFSILYNDN